MVVRYIRRFSTSVRYPQSRRPQPEPEAQTRARCGVDVALKRLDAATLVIEYERDVAGGPVERAQVGRSAAHQPIREAGDRRDSARAVACEPVVFEAYPPGVAVQLRGRAVEVDLHAGHLPSAPAPCTDYRCRHGLQDAIRKEAVHPVDRHQLAAFSRYAARQGALHFEAPALEEVALQQVHARVLVAPPRLGSGQQPAIGVRHSRRVQRGIGGTDDAPGCLRIGRRRLCNHGGARSRGPRAARLGPLGGRAARPVFRMGGCAVTKHAPVCNANSNASAPVTGVHRTVRAGCFDGRGTSMPRSTTAHGSAPDSCRHRAARYGGGSPAFASTIPPLRATACSNTTFRTGVAPRCARDARRPEISSSTCGVEAPAGFSRGNRRDSGHRRTSGTRLYRAQSCRRRRTQPVSRPAPIRAPDVDGAPEASSSKPVPSCS